MFFFVIGATNPLWWRWWNALVHFRVAKCVSLHHYYLTCYYTAQCADITLLTESNLIADICRGNGRTLCSATRYIYHPHLTKWPIQHSILLTAKHKHRLGRALFFYSKTGFWPFGLWYNLEWPNLAWYTDGRVSAVCITMPNSAIAAERHISRGQPHPSPKGRGPSFSPNSGTYMHTAWETTKFCMVIKLDAREIFTRLTTNADARSVCGS